MALEPEVLPPEDELVTPQPWRSRRDEPAFLGAEGRFDQLIAWVAEGGTLLTLARLWRIPRWRIMRWVREDKDRIAALADAEHDRKEVRSERIIEQAETLAFVDIGKAYDEKGGLLPIHQMPVEVRRAITGLESNQLSIDGHAIGEVKKIKYVDPLKALEFNAKLHGEFADKQVIEHTLKLEDVLTLSREGEGNGKESS